MVHKTTCYIQHFVLYRRSTANGILLGAARVGAILGIFLFGLFIDVHPTIPILIAGSCFVAAGICSLPLPATNRKTLLE